MRITPFPQNCIVTCSNLEKNPNRYSLNECRNSDSAIAMCFEFELFNEMKSFFNQLELVFFCIENPGTFKHTLR